VDQQFISFLAIIASEHRFRCFVEAPIYRSMKFPESRPAQWDLTVLNRALVKEWARRSDEAIEIRNAPVLKGLFN
jgi:hypothetical protein